MVSVTREFYLSSWELGLLASLPGLAAILGALGVGVSMDKFGRKRQQQ